MGHKRVRRIVWVPCGECFGCGSVGKDGMRKPCNVCLGRGEVEKYLTEFVTDDEAEAEAAR